MVDTLDSNSINTTITRLSPLVTSETEMYDSIDSGIKGKTF
jgi:hypothetical protein